VKTDEMYHMNKQIRDTAESVTPDIFNWECQKTEILVRHVHSNKLTSHKISLAT
jgi:hypothetical protein